MAEQAPASGRDHAVTRRVRLRVRFCKVGKVRFTSHRDVARLWERALRRTGVPVAYTAGFTPRPRLSFGLALPTGYESLGEYLDIEVQPDRYGGEEVTLAGHNDGTVLDLAEVGSVLSDALPSGMEVQALQSVEGRVESLQEEVTACTWRFGIRELDRAEAEATVVRLLASSTLAVERARKGVPVVADIRPAVFALAVADGGGDGHGTLPSKHSSPVQMVTTLAAKPHVVRPSELVGVLAPGGEMTGAVRTHQWIERQGQMVEPLPPAGESAPRPSGAAS